MRAYLILAIAIPLLLAQAGIVAIGLFAPHVSPQYRAFFIEHSTDEWHG
jgi:hypothetical protein